jgi:hypothetical protein
MKASIFNAKRMEKTSKEQVMTKRLEQNVETLEDVMKE